jgi:hypothetical protein
VRFVAFALLSLLAAGAGCGSCLDDQTNGEAPSPPTHLEVPIKGGSLRRVERPLPQLSINGSDAAPAHPAEDAGVPAEIR